MKLDFAYSPCPNDTYTFHGIASRKITIPGYSIQVHHHDIESLNTFAFAGKYAITKMSFHAWLLLAGQYRLLKAGNALGFGCGPVLVARNNIRPKDLPALRIVLPGEHTTAHLLFRLYCPAANNKTFTRYDRIFDEILAGRADAGVVIHESRFLYEQAGLHKVCDLGQWWEETVKAPLPLGAIAVRNDIPATLDTAIEDAIRKSLTLARENPSAAMPYIKEKAMELDEAVITRHIRTFVNDFTLELGEPGRLAIAKLKELAARAGITS